MQPSPLQQPADAPKPEGPSKTAADAIQRKELGQRFAALKSERSPWDRQWKDIAKHMRPYGFRIDRSEANRGDKKGADIINSTPLVAARTLAGGMLTGITSPARPWFRLTVAGDAELTEKHTVKFWLSDVEKAIRLTMAKSNLYGGLHQVYADLGPFGIACLLVEEDEQDGVRGYVFPVGSYCLALSPRGDVDALFREQSLTVAQVVKLFGLEACSQNVRTMHERRQLDTRVDIVHAILPNEEWVEGALGWKGKRICSLWWEMNAGDDAGFLRRGGYEEMPVMSPRWDVTGEDTYGRSPGWLALGDCRALQMLERRKGQAAEKIVSPPMSAPVAAKATPISLLPNAINYVDALGAGQAMRPAIDLNPQVLAILEQSIRIHEDRIRQTFFADLWLSITQSDGQMTAREVAERREEKLQQLGTVLEALGEELLDPLIDRVFAILLRQGRIPPPPEELQGRDLKVEYVSIAAAAQKVLSITGLERIATFAANLSAVKPDILDKVDFDQLMDEAGDALGVPPAIIVPDESVAKTRAAREQQQQQAQQLQQAAVGADAAKKLAGAQLENPSALSEMLRAAGQR
jgi:hypothetical protein